MKTLKTIYNQASIALTLQKQAAIEPFKLKSVLAYIPRLKRGGFTHFSIT